MKVYLRMLPDKCCPLFRLEDSLFVPRELIDMYLQPKFSIKQFRNGNEITLVNELSYIKSMVELTAKADKGMRIIVSATAGLGKSAFSSHSTRRWMFLSYMLQQQKDMLEEPCYAKLRRWHSL